VTASPVLEDGGVQLTLSICEDRGAVIDPLEIQSHRGIELPG
jgi:hypothetical protein